MPTFGLAEIGVMVVVAIGLVLPALLLPHMIVAVIRVVQNELQKLGRNE